MSWHVETIPLDNGAFRVRVVDQAGRCATAMGTDVGVLVTQCIRRARQERYPTAYVEQPTL